MNPRTLVVLRHAKSDWPAGVPDHSRPLGPRGRRDAPAAGTWIAEHVGDLDRALVSTAERTRQTWALAAAELTVAEAAEFDDRVYEASATGLLSVLRGLPDSVGSAILVGHNPGCEDLAITLAGAHDDEAWAAITTKYPTSGVAVLRFFVPWRDLAPGLARLDAFAVPRG